MRNPDACSGNVFRNTPGLIDMRRCCVYVDESGDLGLSERSSRNITLAATITSSPAQLERIARRIRKRHLEIGMRSMPELKFHHSTPRTRRRVLELLAALQDLKILTLVVDKRALGARFCPDRKAFYRAICGLLLRDLPLVERFPGQVGVVFDARRGERSRGAEFDRFVREEIEEGDRRAGLVVPQVRVSRFDSLNSGGLQMADFVAGAVQRRHELEDSVYWRVISSKIASENVYRKIWD